MRKTVQVGIIAVGCICFAASRVDIYLEQARKALGRPIRVVDMPDTRVELGLTTFDKPGEVVIEIQNGLPHDMKDDVLAHELGHVLLRARGFVGGGGLTGAAMSRDRNFMIATAETLNSCYQNPLADAEATAHGFHPERIADYIAEGVERRVTLFDIIAMEKRDELWPNYQAVYLYCIELRPHTFREAELEQKFAVEPKIRKLKYKLTKQLGVSRCRTPRDCFERAKRLRDTAGFNGFITLSDPKSRQQE